MLTFREGMECETTEYGSDGTRFYKTPAGTTAENIILEGADVVKAEPVVNQDTSQFMVSLEFSEAARKSLPRPPSG